MGYYKEEFNKRGFDTMFKFLQIGNQKANVPQYKQAIQDLITMMTQKNSGQINNDNKSIGSKSDLKICGSLYFAISIRLRS